jgi:hypothetical protein
VHLEFLAVDVSGPVGAPESSGRSVCTSPVSATGRYQTSCQLKKAQYAVHLRNTRDGRTLDSNRVDFRTATASKKLTEIDFEACGVQTVELAQPESVPGAAKSEESSLE